MKKICFIVPYFGKLPQYFQVWLESCRYNPTINWIVFTDDKSKFNYPENVSVYYLSFAEMKDRIQNCFEYDICLDIPYKLVDFKIAYGEIFENYLSDYDFWGFCDIDLIWGNIRNFFTDELLTQYEKIGDQGHSTIFKNTRDINSLYRKKIDNQVSYREIATKEMIFASDKEYISNIFDYFKKDVFKKVIYAGLEKYKAGFFLQNMPPEEDYKNWRQVFTWRDGCLTRWYVYNNSLYSEEFLYIHFFARPMKNEINKMDSILIYPDVYRNYYGEVSVDLVRRYGKKNEISYLIRVFRQNKNRISLKKVLSYFAIKFHLYKPPNPSLLSESDNKNG